MANVRTQNRSRMEARVKASGKKPGVPKAKVPALRPSTNVAVPRGGAGIPSISEPSGGPVARRASTDIAERAIRGESPGMKDIGSGRSAGARGFPSPKPQLKLPSAEDMSGRGQRGNNMGRAAALGIGAGMGIGAQKGIQSLATGPNAGMDTTGTIAALNKSDRGNQRVVMKGDLPVGVAPKRASTGFTDAADVGPPRPLGPTGKPAPKPMARKPRATADDDAFLNDLRASAAKMKAETADMAGATGRMKGAMEDFQFAADDAAEGYKKGGRVGGRGDGKAVRGRTKGRFI